MRFGFVTCVSLGRACIEEILSFGGHLELLVTLKDEQATSKSGRVYLDDLASDHGIPLLKIRHINDPAAIDMVRDSSLDWLFIIGWSQIAGPELLATPRKGVIGIHPTLLPTGRGRASIPWAIIKGLKETGVTMFKLDEGVDSGPIIDQVVLPIAPNETASSLYARVVDGHRRLMRKAWRALDSGELSLTPQDETVATEWPARRPEDGEILPHMAVAEVDRLVRAVSTPYPGAFWRSATGEVIRVWKGRRVRRNDSQIEIPLSDGIYYASVVSSEDGGKDL